MSWRWYVDNPEYCRIENFTEVLWLLDIYWSVEDEKDPQLDYDKLEELKELEYHLWETYHKPYIEAQKRKLKKEKLKRILNPLKWF